MSTSILSKRSGATTRAALPQRKSAVAPEAPRLPFRVLQNSRMPAQLSLYLRPATTSR